MWTRSTTTRCALRPRRGNPGLGLLTALILALGAGAFARPAIASAQRADPTSARALLDQVDDLYRSSQSRARIRMSVKTTHWERTLELEAWSKGRDLSLFRILAPKKEKGTTTLRRDNEIWNYLPKVRRVMKLPSSMMSASWMGSDFSNDDLVKESRMSRDYEFDFGERSEFEGEPVREIVCTPKPDAPVVWGRLSVFVASEGDPIPVAIVYYDEDLNEARVMRFSEVRAFGDRRVPSRVSLQPSDEPDRHTIMTYEELDFDTPIPDDLFTLQSLKR
jgi:outer membrane lipoprotein-sorting protein